MKQLGDFRDLWTNVTGQRSQAEDDNSRSPPAVISVTSDDLSQNAHPREGRPAGVGGGGGTLDGEKAGASLLFSGIFLGLMGMTFTAMGWLNYDAGKVFEWTQLLGPILLSVGGTFMLISVCRFGMLSWLPCGQWRRHRADEDDATPEILEHVVPTAAAAGRSFVFNGAGQPMVFHGQYGVPPPYAAVAGRGAGGPAAAQLSCSPSSPPPQYHAVCPLDNPAFTLDEGRATRAVGTHHPPGRAQRTAAEYQGRDKDDNTTARPRPPAYDDIYPSAVRQHDLNAS